MAYKLEVTPEAEQDTDKIVKYMVEKLINHSAATRFLDDVNESYQRIEKNPHMYCLCQDPRLQDMGYRKVVIKNYLILYRIDEISNTVYVVRIVYGGRNYTEMV